MKQFFLKMKRLGGLAYGSALALMLSMFVPNMARADAVSDAIKNFDTGNIMLAGAAIITFVMAIVAIRYVIRMIKGA